MHGEHRMNTSPEDSVDRSLGLLAFIGAANSAALPGQMVPLDSQLDLCAARSVCPRAFGKQFGVEETEASRRQDGFRTAVGRKVVNRGSRTITGTTNHGIRT